MINSIKSWAEIQRNNYCRLAVGTYTTSEWYIYSLNETDAVANKNKKKRQLHVTCASGLLLHALTSRRVYCENCTKTVRQPILGGCCLYSFTSSSASFSSCMYRNACNRRWQISLTIRNQRLNHCRHRRYHVVSWDCCITPEWPRRLVHIHKSAGGDVVRANVIQPLAFWATWRMFLFSKYCQKPSKRDVNLAPKGW